jgi:competence protein ComEC
MDHPISAGTHRRGGAQPVPPLILITLALLAGQLVAGAGVKPTPVVLLPVVAIAVGAVTALRRWRLVGLIVIAFSWGDWSAARVLQPVLPASHVATWADRGAVTIEGRLLADSERAPQRTRLRLEAERAIAGGEVQASSGRVLVTLRHSQREWRAGDRVRVRLWLRRPRNFGNPGEFDYEAYLARRGIYATAFLADDHGITLVERPSTNGWFTAWRRGVGAMIDRRLSDPERQVLRALIIGDGAGLSPSLRRTFARAGVSHVLSISGLHVGIVAAFGYFLWRWLLGRSRWLLLRANVPKLAVAGSSIAVLLYAGIAGSSTATIRAVVMILIFVGAVVVDRQRDLLVSLAAAACAIALVWPGAVLDISFQLSFTAVLFLVIGMARFWPLWRQWEERRLVRLRRGPIRHARSVAAYFAVSASALVGTAPLSAFHFNQVSWVALLANALVVPLLGTAAVTLGLLGALIYLVSDWVGGFCVSLAWPALWLGDHLVAFFGGLPDASLRVVTPSLLELALIYGALLAGLCLRGRWRRSCLAAIAMMAVADGGWWYYERFYHADLRVTFLSVGQGDSAVVECPGGRVMVIDGGGLGDGTFDVGERIIAPYLWSRKIGRLDVLVMSHPQWDHYGGLTFLARAFGAREFWSTGDRAVNSVHFAELERALSAAAVQKVALAAGAERSCGEVAVRVLGPPRAFAASTNERSLVLQLQRGSMRLLFTGDIEQQAEHALLASADNGLASTVLKVAHHGSATSSSPAFVAAVAPRLAVASLGFGNRYGFPAARTVRTFRNAGIELLRTDRDGAVTVSVRGAGEVTRQVYRHVR